MSATKTSRQEPASVVLTGRATPLYVKAFRILEAEIAGGILAAGALVQESQLVDRFGISRAPARQALELLADSGLVRKRAGRGYEVRSGQRGEQRPPERVSSASDTRLTSLPTWEQIYADVEGQIVARIPFGSWRIRESELARHYEVSRTVARDVIGRLQQRGLVRKNDSSHWYAPALSPQNIVELYELRWTLEPLALAKAAPDIPAEEIARLKQRLLSAISHADRITGAVLDDLETDLHVTLLGHCRNETLMRAIAMHQSLLIAHRFLYRQTPHLFESEPFLPEHLGILECLEKGDATGACQALEEHLRASADRAISRVGDVTSHLSVASIPYLTPLG